MRAGKKRSGCRLFRIRLSWLAAKLSELAHLLRFDRDVDNSVGVNRVIGRQVQRKRQAAMWNVKGTG